jgi:hypothetical protein
MTQFNAQITLDLAAAQIAWQQAKSRIAAQRATVDAVQQSLAGITIQGTPGAGGTVTFTVSAAQILADLATLHQAIADALAAVEAVQQALVSPPITVQVA